MAITEQKVTEIEQAYQSHHQVDGVTFTRWMRNGGEYAYDTSVDNALFTGFYLAAAAFRFGVTQNKHELQAIENTVQGISLLSSITGKPGILVRLAFPLHRAWEKIGYDKIKSREVEGNTWGRRLREGWIFEGKHNGTGYMYGTRTTRDQLTGIVFGLSIAWDILSSTKVQDARIIQIKQRISFIVHHLVRRLTSTRWSLKDHTGKRHNTRADKVRLPLKSALLMLNMKCNHKQHSMRRIKLFYRFLWLHTFYYPFTRSMFAWNLRHAIAYSLWINTFNGSLRTGAEAFVTRLGKFTKTEGNAFFSFLEDAMTNKVNIRRLQTAHKRLAIVSTTGHNGYFIWQKPWGEGKPAGVRRGPGIDVLLPYWMRKYHHGEGQ